MGGLKAFEKANKTYFKSFQLKIKEQKTGVRKYRDSQNFIKHDITISEALESTRGH